ncbi:zinc finger protein 184-like isoform X1 [Zerene cesonia]|uniref:zinc finger protein 184-like isoform X1 n=1 Tax=Zerene cesonia TaxID=33412 RepID=UPI0018E50557|nr:zinc finger protein 184-like isoform X1 [Zerene cesonia]
MEFQTKTVRELKTYSRSTKLRQNSEGLPVLENSDEPLTTKDAIRFLLNGTLRLRVCRYCLNKTSDLNELDEVLVLAGKSGLYEVTVKDIIASFHPFKVAYDPNFPNKICKKCLDKALACYLFTQQCEQSERALRNYFEDIDEKFHKLDPLEPVKKRGKRKLKPNYNVLYAEHLNIIDYAEPIMNIVNLNTIPLEIMQENELECSKCWKILPDKFSLANHEKSHPKTMWYHCKLCGKSFVKYFQLKKHKRLVHSRFDEIAKPEIGFTCQQCGIHIKLLDEHLRHIEKHKFKNSLDNLIKRNTSNMCSICFSDNEDLTGLNETMSFHGGHPGLTGERSIYSMVSSVFPDITLASYTGTKICKHCLSKLTTTYIFLLSVKNIRNRLNTCISLILGDLDNVEEDKNIIIEIGQDAILPSFEYEDIDLIKDEDMKVDVLEDEFRVSDSESIKSEHLMKEEDDSDSVLSEMISSPDEIEFENPAKNATKTYAKRNAVNGYQSYMDCEYLDDVCSEFLTFRKRTKSKKNCLFTCPLCHKHFVSDYFLNKHILKHRFETVKCKYCTRTFKSKFHLFEHVKVVHLIKTEVFGECDVCGRNYIDAVKLNKHIKRHHDTQCLLCDKFFKTQVHHDRHMQRHIMKFKKSNREETLTCSFCEKACINENDLSLHVNKVHLLMKPYNCDMCEKQFYTEYNLNCHKRLHTMFSKEECNFCSRVFKCRKNLVVHLRKHINIKPHYCPVCSKSFYSESSMKRHMKMYHGGRFCCRLCRTVVDSNTDLKNHIKVAHSCM